MSDKAIIDGGISQLTMFLRGDAPTTEEALVDLMLENTALEREEITESIQTALDRNVIRWVAFRGYCLGGRPE